LLCCMMLAFIAASLPLGLLIGPGLSLRFSGVDGRHTFPDMKVVNEFSRTIGVAGVDRRSRPSQIAATPEECAALAKRFDLLSIGGIVANVSLSLVNKRTTRIRAAGKLSATDVARIGKSGATQTLQVGEVGFETFFKVQEEVNKGGLMDPSEEDTFDEDIEDGQVRPHSL
jgi:hypothetical protein